MNAETMKRGKEIYAKILPDIKRYSGQYVAIEPVSGIYFIAPDLLEAISKAKKRFPDKIFYTVEIGKETIAEWR